MVPCSRQIGESEVYKLYLLVDDELKNSLRVHSFVASFNRLNLALLCQSLRIEPRSGSVKDGQVRLSGEKKIKAADLSAAFIFTV
jgi:hypothetical protein